MALLSGAVEGKEQVEQGHELAHAVFSCHCVLLMSGRLGLWISGGLKL